MTFRLPPNLDGLPVQNVLDRCGACGTSDDGAFSPVHLAWRVSGYNGVLQPVPVTALCDAERRAARPWERMAGVAGSHDYPHALQRAVGAARPSRRGPGRRAA